MLGFIDLQIHIEASESAIVFHLYAKEVHYTI